MHSRVIAISIAVLLLGLLLRGWVFEQSRPIRFMEDMRRGYGWGQAARQQGVLGLYDSMRNQQPYHRVWLDYAPFRLMTMWAWASINSMRYDRASVYENTLDFALPMIALNTLADIASSAAVFVLVRRFSTRNRALTAAACLFLNPAVLISGYAWITWDGWLVPFFLWSLCFALRDRWWISGVLFAMGALFKGQILFLAVVFTLWPILQGRCAPTLRWLCGAVFALGIGVSPWMLRNLNGSVNRGSVMLLACALVVMAIIAFLFRLRRWSVRPRLWIAGGVLGAAILLCMTITGASDAWFICGYEFGLRHFNRLEVGLPNNIPAVLDKSFDFGSDTDVYHPIFQIAGHTLTLKPAMQLLTLILTLISTFALARLHKRGDPRVLIAGVLPWLFVYLFPLQIHERYLLFFAASSMCLLAAGVLPMLLGGFTSVIAALSTLAVLLKPERMFAHQFDQPDSIFIRFGAPLREFAMRLHPDSAWALLAAAIVLLTILWLPRKNEAKSLETSRPNGRL